MDVDEHCKELKGENKALIKIPHKLTIATATVFDKEFEYPILLSSKKDYYNIARINSIHANIRHDLANVGPADTLIFYTEYELLTHYIVSFFKEKKAKVLMIEEGLSTYQALVNCESKLNFSDRLLSYYLQRVLGYTSTLVTRTNNVMHLLLKDQVIDAVMVYNKVEVKRALQTKLLKTKTYLYSGLDDQKVVFLNERIYDYYVAFDDYITILTDILLQISNQCKMVYFKFHPREILLNRKKITEVIGKLDRNIIIITQDTPVELMINTLKVKYIASFFATTLLNHSHSNCVCLYLFHMYSVLMQHPLLIIDKKTLESLNYNFLINWSDFHTDGIGFPAWDEGSQITLKDHLNMYDLKDDK